ncbi:unnamed protein product, partial [Effrenium voratum]
DTQAQPGAGAHAMVEDATPGCAAKAARARAWPIQGRGIKEEAALSSCDQPSEKLFELANRPSLCLRIGGSVLEVSQDRSTQEHSGGVVWETAFFLLRYLEREVLPGLGRRLRVVELGAGCGLLGLGLARLGCEVVLTDQPLALPNLRHNAEGSGAEVQVLSWGDVEHMEAVRRQGPFDLVVGSDVVFALRFVEPLLQTIGALLQDSGTCWLCLQRRDPDAHALLMQKAAEAFEVQELSFEGLQGLEAAQELECLLLRLTRRPAIQQVPGSGAGERKDPKRRTGKEQKVPPCRRNPRRWL